MTLRKATVVALLAVAILIAAPVVRVAFAGIAWGTITCCCGEHAGDHDCGCPDCPAGERASDGDSDDGAPHVRPCGASAEWVSPATFAPFVAPTVPVVIAPPRRALPIPEPFEAPPSPTAHVETPPS